MKRWRTEIPFTLAMPGGVGAGQKVRRKQRHSHSTMRGSLAGKEREETEMNSVIERDGRVLMVPVMPAVNDTASSAADEFRFVGW